MICMCALFQGMARVFTKESSDPSPHLYCSREKLLNYISFEHSLFAFVWRP